MGKKEKKQNRYERRLGDDVQYDVEKENEDTSKDIKKETTINDIFKAITMLKDQKEYNLFDSLNSTRAGITI